MGITLYYWGPHKGCDFYGRAIGIYLTLNQAGAAYESKPAGEMPDGAALASPAIDIDGTMMGQTPAILLALGEKFGLAGKTPEEKMRVMHAVLDMDDVFGQHGKMAEDAARKDKWFSYLEKKLDGKKWMAGTDEPTVADFHGVFAFEWVDKKKVDFSAYPKTTKWWADLKEYPVVAKMYESCVGDLKMIP